jgi:predicted TIM-barrel fold metal-dependent hydrolase
VDISELIAFWLDAARTQVPDLELFDAHTHLGQNDPDGFRQNPQQLVDTLAAARATGCFVFPMHEPDGYRKANDMVIREAQASDGLMVPFCRVAPGEGAVVEAERALAGGARGIKLHPRAEQFTLDHPEVHALFTLADERTLPILIHAGRGIPALGTDLVRLAGEFPNARVILAHAGISDLSWIWRAAAHLPNLLFDSSWWSPSDLLALFTLIPPAQILFASDAPYGRTAVSAAVQVRLTLQAGWSQEQVRLFAGGQSQRIAAGDPLAVAGPPVGERDSPGRVLLDRVGEMLAIGAFMTVRGGDGREPLALAALACQVPDEVDDAPVFRTLARLLDQYTAASAAYPDDRRRLAPLILAVHVARTPDVPLPPTT